MSSYFNPNLLNNFDDFKKFFNADEIIDKITKLDKSQLQPPKTSGRFHYLLNPLNYLNILGGILTALSAWFLETLNFQTLARPVRILDGHLFYSFIEAGSSKPNLLCTARNTHRLFDTDVYLPNHLSLTDIKDPYVRKSLLRTDFCSSGGLCGGGVYWFNHLFLQVLGKNKLKNLDFTIQDCAIAVAQQFRQGVPKQGALLQSLEVPMRDRVLNTGFSWVKFPMQSQRAALKDLFFHKAWRPVLKWYWEGGILPYHLTYDHIKKNPNSLFESLKSLNDGTYLLALPKHAVSYLSYKGQQFLFDPNAGLFEIKNSKELWQHLERYFPSTNPKGNSGYVFLHQAKHNPSFFEQANEFIYDLPVIVYESLLYFIPISIPAFLLARKLA